MASLYIVLARQCGDRTVSSCNIIGKKGTGNLEHGFIGSLSGRNRCVVSRQGSCMAVKSEIKTGMKLGMKFGVNSIAWRNVCLYQRRLTAARTWNQAFCGICSGDNSWYSAWADARYGTCTSSRTGSRTGICPAINPGMKHGMKYGMYPGMNPEAWKQTGRFNSSLSSGQSGHTDDNQNDVSLSILDHIDSLPDIPLSDIRNFCIIAHVDHGKSSLASRLLEHSGNLGKQQMNPKEEITLLDTLNVEQQRGITVKSSAASMLHRHPSATNPHGVLLLNMVDTPGHADFGMEVSKSLANVEGAALLLDSVRGVQAQTWSVYEKATKMGLRVVPALTKIDLDNARPLEVALGASELLGLDPDRIIETSARARIGIQELLDSIGNDIPPPRPLPDSTILRAKVIDSWFESRRGVICLVRLLSGSIAEGNRISIVAHNDDDDDDGAKSNSNVSYSVQEVGLVVPHRIRTKVLHCGQMGYVIAGLRDPREARPGTVLALPKDVSKVTNDAIIPLGQHRSVLYASVHPVEGDGFDELQVAVEKLALNDTGLEIQRTSGSTNNNNNNNNNNSGGPFLAPGLRVGFQGLLHVEVFRQRLLDEFHLEAIVTPPKVPYLVQYLPGKRHHHQQQQQHTVSPTEEIIEDLIHWPSHGRRFKIQEPIVDVRILAPMDHAGNIMELITRKRGTNMQTKPIDERTWCFSSTMPWSEVVTDFHDELQTASAGHASFDVTESNPPMQPSDLCKVDILLNDDTVHALAFACHRTQVQARARHVCQKLQSVLPRQQFVTIIRAKSEGRIVASEKLRAYRKDVLTTGGSKAVGGGDVSRKKKLLEKQKRGKKRRQSEGKVRLSQDAFNSVISKSN